MPVWNQTVFDSNGGITYIPPDEAKKYREEQEQKKKGKEETENTKGTVK